MGPSKPPSINLILASIQSQVLHTTWTDDEQVTLESLDPTIVSQCLACVPTGHECETYGTTLKLYNEL